MQKPLAKTCYKPIAYKNLIIFTSLILVDRWIKNKLPAKSTIYDNNIFAKERKHFFSKKDSVNDTKYYKRAVYKSKLIRIQIVLYPRTKNFNYD